MLRSPSYPSRPLAVFLFAFGTGTLLIVAADPVRTPFLDRVAGQFSASLVITAVAFLLVYGVGAFRDRSRYSLFDPERLAALARADPVAAWRYARQCVRFPSVSALGQLIPLHQVNEIEAVRIIEVLRILRAITTNCNRPKLAWLINELSACVSPGCSGVGFRKYREIHSTLYTLFVVESQRMASGDSDTTS